MLILCIPAKCQHQPLHQRARTAAEVHKDEEVDGPEPPIIIIIMVVVLVIKLGPDRSRSSQASLRPTHHNYPQLLRHTRIRRAQGTGV